MLKMRNHQLRKGTYRELVGRKMQRINKSTESKAGPP